MNILITVHSYYPSKDGVQFVTEYHAENLVKFGHKVTVVTLNRGCNIEQETYNGVEIIRFNAWVKHSFYYGDKKKYQNLILDLSKKSDVLINVCTQCPTTDWILPILDNISCKKILYLHGIHKTSWNFGELKNVSSLGHKIWNNIRWGRFYAGKKNVFKKYDHIVQLHKFDYGYIYFEKKYGIKSNVIENAADDAFFNKGVEQSLTKNIVCVANYSDRKNQKFILESFYKAQLDDNCKLVFVGSEKNSYYDSLVVLEKKMIKKYGKKNVDILFGISREDTIKIVKSAWIYALGSKWEAYPISIVEAMAAGIPFISTNVGCVKYLPGGFIVNNVDEMAYWFKLLFENEETRSFVGMLGSSYAKKHLNTESKTHLLLNLAEN